MIYQRRARIGKLLLGIHKCMLMAIVETPMIFRCYVHSVAYILVRSVIFYMCGVFFIHVFEWDSVLCSRVRMGIYRKGMYYRLMFQFALGIEQTSDHRSRFFKHHRELDAFEVGKMPRRAEKDFHKFMKHICAKRDYRYIYGISNIIEFIVYLLLVLNLLGIGTC